MDQDAIESDITEPSLWKDTVVYENTTIVSKRQTGFRTQTVEDSPYETLKLEDLGKPKVDTGIQENNLKRLKYVIYTMTVLIIVLYITLISLVIILFVPKHSVDGHWTDWSSWTSCDVTCGNGTHIRTRTCTNPLPANKGNDCIGEGVESSECLKDNCPVEGQWTQWSGWAECDVTCGKGTHQRTRTCTNQVVQTNTEIECIGETLQTAECSKGSCPVDGRWAHWSNWSSCDVTFGKGRQLRIRTCTNPTPDNKGRDCLGESLQTSQCSIGTCSIDGRWAHWSSWTACDVTCGKGRQLRTRRCTNPMPENKGKDCIGESLQSSQCSRGNCSTYMSAFSVKSPKTYSYINGINKLTFSNTIYQYGNDYSISKGTYTCSKSGVYHFSVTLVKKRSSSRVDAVYCYLFKNRQNLIRIRVDPTNDDTDKGSAAISQSIVTYLNVGDTVFLYGCSNPSTTMEDWSSFTGFLLYDNN